MTMLHKICLIMIIAIIGFAGSIQAEVMQTYKNTLPAPTEEEWQNLLESRSDRHACMQKTYDPADNLKYALVAGFDQPTVYQINYDVLHYEINLELDFSGYSIDGYVESALKATDDGVSIIEFNLHDNITVTAVSIDGSPAGSFSHSSSILTINMSQTFNTDDNFSVKIEYYGPPVYNDGGLQFTTYGSDDVAYTKCEPWGSRNWWPCKDFPFDKPDSVDIIITHPSEYKLVSNGLKQSEVNNGNGTTTTHWHESYPIATYLVQIGCTDYTLYSDSWQYLPGQYMPVENYSYPGISPTSSYYSLYYMRNYTKPSLEALSYYFSLYPFVDEKYGHNHFGWGGAMEHQTLTSISHTFNTEYVIAHELGHQWAGDLVTCYNFHHIWLNEGFASYSEALHFRYHYGESYYKSWMNNMKHLDAGTPYVEDVLTQDIFDNTTVYDKAAWLAYMLHQFMGDSLFIEAMDNYFNHPNLKYKAAFTSDLEAAFEQVYGSDLSWFFGNWVYNPGNPDYVYSFKSELNLEKDGYNSYVLLSQVQSGPIFPMPVDMRVFAGSFDSSLTVFNNQRGQLWEFQTSSPITSVWIDHDEKILRSLTYSPDFQMSILAGKEVDTAYIGVPYYAEFTVIAGVPDYSWDKISGQFPYGLTLTSGNTAILSGTPNWTSNFAFTIEATDSDSPANKDTISLQIVVLEGEAPDVPELLTPLDDATLSDDTPTFTWSSTAGSGGSYKLQYSQDYNFSSNVVTVADVPVTYHEAATALDPGVWYWHVEAVSDIGTHSGYQGTPYNFTLSSGGLARGDANDDGTVNVSDAVFIINYVFIGGPPPNPLYIADVNCDSSVNVSDAVYIINYVFIGGQEPCSG